MPILIATSTLDFDPSEVAIPWKILRKGGQEIVFATDPATNKSPLFGRKTTALLKRQELLGYKLTKSKIGNYYLTYPTPVEDEITAALASPSDFIQGPTPIFRDSATNLKPGFTVRDKNYLSPRWPGDVHTFANAFLAMLKSAQP